MTIPVSMWLFEINRPEVLPQEQQCRGRCTLKCPTRCRNELESMGSTNNSEGSTGQTEETRAMVGNHLRWCEDPHQWLGQWLTVLRSTGQTLPLPCGKARNHPLGILLRDRLPSWQTHKSNSRTIGTCPIFFYNRSNAVFPPSKYFKSRGQHLLLCNAGNKTGLWEWRSSFFSFIGALLAKSKWKLAVCFSMTGHSHVSSSIPHWEMVE